MTEHHGRKGARSKYKFPQQRYANQVLNIKLFCEVHNCDNYTKGTLGYNGGYVDEDGTNVDLRNKGWYCEKHSKESKR